MFKCSTNSPLLLLVLIFSSPTFADVHKWKDADGKTHYGDAPPIAGTAKVKTDKQTADQIANGERIRRNTEREIETLEKAEKQAAHDQKCQELVQIDRSRLTLGQAMAARREYEALCLSPAERQASEQRRANAQLKNKLDQIIQQQDFDRIWGKTCKPDGLGRLRCY